LTGTEDSAKFLSLLTHIF